VAAFLTKGYHWKSFERMRDKKEGRNREWEKTDTGYLVRGWGLSVMEKE